jgi:CRISPR-associated protein Cas2
VFVVVSYDIPDDKRRVKVAKALKAFGDRVQYSVFECNVDKDQLAKMERRLVRLIEESEDSVRIYLVCNSCKTRITIFGQGTVSEDPELIII